MKEISGDIPLSFSQKIYYLAFNFFRGLFGFRLLKVIHWVPKKITDISQDSLFRIYSNDFVKTVLPTLFENKKITILDIGCGSGYVRTQLQDLGFIGTYEGIDIKKHKDFDEYSVGAFSNILTLVPAEEFTSVRVYDLIFSFTALEHVPNDFAVIKKGFEHLASSGVQVHIVPSFWSLFVYGFHGFRQFTKARIKKLFSDYSYVVYAVGGLGSSVVQFIWVTIPERLFRKWPLNRSKDSYQKAKRWALTVDKIVPFFPMQYVIVTSKEYDTKLV